MAKNTLAIVPNNGPTTPERVLATGPITRGNRRSLVGGWRGDFERGEARRRGLRLVGPTALVRAFPTWFQRYLLAEVAPAS